MSSAYLPCSAPSATVIDDSSKLFKNSTNIYNDSSSGSNSDVNNRSSKYNQHESSTFFSRIHSSIGKSILSSLCLVLSNPLFFCYSSFTHHSLYTYFRQSSFHPTSTPFFPISYWCPPSVTLLLPPILRSLFIIIFFGVS